ncbi:hypothetical protein [Clostridium coskatii]|uniref:Uncharacterized protein n=1 Tax=Clostridium coskatii TaxID=1705578 RepID=A0A162LC61_9CLOT|nr:hypothetical protein [Clostridium coskatii]OAA94072.1 hypothetical protein WX73_03642 [Clostridium coskatii]OBR96634.1 hypothetical protein CLCOS_07960 [Clostridium coskatii]
MTQIQILKVKTIRNRHSTLEVSGYIGQNRFYGYLEGVCLTISTPHPLNSKQVENFEEKLQELFPVSYDGKFKKKEIDLIMKDAPFIFSV